LDEENQQNPQLVVDHSLNTTTAQGNHQEPRLAKRNKIETSVTQEKNIMKANNMNETNETMVVHQQDLPHSPTGSSDCGTEVSSVSARREWLNSFSKQHESNPFRKMTDKTTAEAASTRQQQQQQQSRDDTESQDGVRGGDRAPSRACSSSSQKPPKTPLKHTSSQSAASTLVNRLVKSPSGTTTLTSTAASRRTSTAPSSSSVKNYAVPAVGSTPLRTIRSIQREKVKATDEGYASVKELSQWLASDPTSTKKKKHVRRGKNVILKSRHFEKDLENVIVVENNITRGAVSDKKKWLQVAFVKSEEDRADDDTSSVVSHGRYAKSEIAGGTSTYSFQKLREMAAGGKADLPKSASSSDAQSEIITDDAASSLSVADKKDWLKNAFTSKKTSTVASASPSRFGRYPKAQTEVMLGGGQSRDEAASRAKMRFKERSARKLMDTGTTPTKSLKEPPSASVAPSKSEDGIHGQPPTDSIKEEERVDHQVADRSIQQTKSGIEEDVTPVDFRAARDVLVQRSKQNGHKVQVVNKVYLRAKKYEKMEEDGRRKSSPHGHLKASWDVADPNSGRPSNIYEKKYVSDIAPKKSFEELP
jgi:hypothetical protein